MQTEPKLLVQFPKYAVGDKLKDHGGYYRGKYTIIDVLSVGNSLSSPIEDSDKVGIKYIYRVKADGTFNSYGKWMDEVEIDKELMPVYMKREPRFSMGDKVNVEDCPGIDFIIADILYEDEKYKYKLTTVGDVCVDEGLICHA